MRQVHITRNFTVKGKRGGCSALGVGFQGGIDLPTAPQTRKRVSSYAKRLPAVLRFQVDNLYRLRLNLRLAGRHETFRQPVLASRLTVRGDDNVSALPQGASDIRLHREAGGNHPPV